MCKHVAAVLYGIGARLDQQPELLFRLRKVNQEDLVAKAGTRLSKTRKPPASARVLAADDLSEMFGIDLAPPTAPAHPPPRVVTAKPATAKTPAPPRKRPRLPAKQRQEIAERMRQYWAERRARAAKPKAAKR
jgi:uncharacterized Zn finger protein